MILALGLLVSCGAPQNDAGSEEGTASDTDSTQVGDENYGDEISSLDNVISYDDMLGMIGEQDSMNLVVEGMVESVCQKKGCWVNIASQDTTKETMFVKFKDYGFFLPMDCAGDKVVMEGTVYREVTSVDELRHYAEDEGKSPEEIAAITEPVEELKFMASGVILKRQ